MERQTHSQEQSGPVGPVQILCRSGCGFYGHPNFDGMCSKCFRDAVEKKGGAPGSVSENPGKLLSPSLGSDTNVDVRSMESQDNVDVAISNSSSEDKVSESKSPEDITTDLNTESSDKPTKNRCFMCRKKLSLVTGFKCRCDNVFCSIHRYSDKHDCPFDYKAAGRAAISKNNPVVVGSKIEKI